MKGALASPGSWKAQPRADEWKLQLPLRHWPLWEMLGDVIINAFLTVLCCFFHSFGPQPPPYPLVFPSCSLYIPIMRCLSVQNKKGGENSVKLGYYGNVETEQRMGGEGVFLFETSQCERE